MRQLALAVVLTGVAEAVPDVRADRPVAELPVRDVTVFSDRARVTRRGEVTADRWSPAREGVVVRLPALPLSVDPSTVRLEATGARVVRVDVRRAERGEFPRGEAEELAAKLEKLHDEEGAIRDALAAVAGERAFLDGLHPAPEPFLDPKAGPVLLEPVGWRTALSYLDARGQKLADQLAPLELKLRAKLREIAEVSARGQQLLADDNGRPGWNVDAYLDAKGKSAQLALSYMAPNARWYPTYDVRFAPGEGSVDIDLAGLVSQQTGEDWTGARLVLSTAIPASTATLPELKVWKIGDRERFIPTPVAEWQPPVRPPARPPPPQPVPLETEAQRDEYAKRALANAMSSATRPSEPPRPRPTPVAKDKKWEAPSGARGRAQAYAAEKEDSDGEYDQEESSNEPPMPEEAYEDAPAPPPAAYSPKPSMAPMAMAEGMESSVSDSVRSVSRSSGPAPKAVGFGAPRGWTPPTYAADLPAALAGGYDFTYASAREETVRSGAEARRIALYSKRFPAEALVRILPALSKQAYLVTEVKNEGDKPLLKGHANLFVGADLVGEAVVPTTAVGATVTLPLGIDEAIRIERNVQVLASERGVFSKQDVNAYQVDIEIVNPRARAVKAVVVDQIPLRREENVEIAFESAKPAATPDAEEGLLEWKLDLPQGEKKQIRFTYTYARPKSARPWQVVAPLGSR